MQISDEMIDAGMAGWHKAIIDAPDEPVPARRRRCIRAALEAAFAASQEAPASEPLAWRWKHPNEPAWKFGPNHPGWTEASPYIVEPLFTAPVPQATEGWRDISTAPRDGTRFLAAEEDNGWIIGTCLWCKTPHVSIYGFHFTDGDPENWEIAHPKFWQPLPAAPTPKAEGEQQ